MSVLPPELEAARGMLLESVDAGDLGLGEMEAAMKKQEKTDEEILVIKFSELVVRVSMLFHGIETFRAQFEQDDLADLKEDEPDLYARITGIVTAMAGQYKQAADELDRRFPVLG